MPGLQSISLQYKQTYLLDHFSYAFSPKSWTTFLGPSGIGKTTLLRLLAKLTQPESGEIDNTDSTSYLTQQNTLLPWLTALDNVDPFKTAKKEKAMHYFQQVGLKGHEKKYPNELSGGMQQRVALARVLTEDRDLILLDEPFSAIDAITKHDLQDLASQTLQGKTVVMITHDPLEALRLSQHVVVLGGVPATIQQTITLDSQTPRSFMHPLVESYHEILMQTLRMAKEA